MHRANGWATLMVCYSEFAADGTWSAPQFKLVRMRKLNGLWQRTNTFNLKGHHLPPLMTGTVRAMAQAAGS